MRQYAHLIVTGTACFLFWTGTAFSIDSVYSKLDFELGCTWAPAASEEEAQMGGEAVCDGIKNYPVHFAESDIRQFTAYGPVNDPSQFPNGFSEWNSVHNVIEWRMDGGKPFATIHRWFIDNIDPDTGSADASRRGQVLAVSTVGQPDATNDRRVSCMIGYVDARANSSANIIARDVADAYAKGFVCGQDRPKFHGVQGPYSGTPNDLGE